MLRLAEIVGFAHRLRPAHRPPRPQARQRPGPEEGQRGSFSRWPTSASAAWRSARRSRSRGATRPKALLAATVARGSYTPLYASPQQMAGLPADPRDDVYALGVIWYQLLAGDLAKGVGVDYAEDLREAGVADG